MGRHRGSKKFSFPLPRRPRLDADEDHDADDRDGRSTPSFSIREWPASASHQDSSTSKAHRVLGTSAAPYSPVPHQLSVPPSPGYMSITISEASFGSRADHRTEATATDNGGFPKHTAMSKRSSSTILGRVYNRDGRGGSDNSSVSHRLQPQTSNSTMRSHYDAKNSPLSISQQTSDSAVRDRALRRGQPTVVTDGSHAGENRKRGKDSRKGKPSRLDLSKLFPTPKIGVDHNQASLLLSPTKMVNSPAPMSTTSEYFPRPMTRAPTPQGGQVKLKPTTYYQHSTVPTPTSPTRLFKPDEYDNAKVHVRRPPKGIQHWFDALDDDTDESSDDSSPAIHAPQAVRPGRPPRIPVRKTSLSRMLPHKFESHPVSTSQHLSTASRNDIFAHEDIVEMSRLTSPSQFSINSLLSTRTKESSLLSKSNLQDSSVLSFSSSSEDEFEHTQMQSRDFMVRKSLEIPDDAGEIIIGQAQAFEVHPNRRPSVGRVSTRSTSTSAATIEVMYTPEPLFSPCHLPSRNNLGGSRRSCHTRQPSVIPEDDDVRPQTSANIVISSSSHSIRSARTSASEPKLRSSSSHKLMAVTAEEEALLEMMRKKRAAMAKLGLLDTDPTLGSEDDKQPKTPTEVSSRKYRTSGFLSMEASPVRGVEPKKTRRAVPPSPLILSPRGRQPRTAYDGESELNKSCDGSPATQTALPHHLPTPGEFSPLDPFPPPSSPTPPISVTSPTNTDQPSSLPSPVTPGLRMGEPDLAVKVASSDTSSNNSEDVSILGNGVIDALSNRNKPDSPSHELASQHQRRRTASSAANIACPNPEPKVLKDFASLSETSSRPPSHIESPFPKLQRRNSRRRSGLTLTTNNSRSSTLSHSSIHVHGIEKRSSRGLSRGNSITSVKNARNSVSEDVLAAWNSLGGTY